MKLAAVLATKGAAVATIEPTATVGQAVAALASRNIGALVVTGPADTVVGIISERDIIRALAADPGALGRPVDALMTRDVACGTPEDDIEPVLAAMTAGHFRHLPVVASGHLVGLVTTGDLVQALLADYAGRIQVLEYRLELHVEQHGVGQ